MIWLLILTGILLPHFGLGGNANKIIAIVLLVLGIVFLVAWPNLDLRIRD